MAFRRKTPFRAASTCAGSASSGAVTLSWLLLVAVTLLPPRPLPAQVQVATEAWRWTSFTAEAGLPSDQVSEVVDAADGTPWAGTLGGLAWYDGFQWHPVTPGQGLPAGPVEALDAVPGGEVLAVLDGRLYRGGREGFRLVQSEAFAHLRIRDAVALSADSLLVLADQDLFLVHDRSWALLQAPGRLRGDPPVARLWRTRAGRVWLNTENGLFRRDPRGWRKMLASHPIGGFHLVELRESPGGTGLAVTKSPERFRGVWTWQGDGFPEKIQEARARFARSGDVGPRDQRLVAYESGNLTIRERGSWTDLGRLAFGGGAPNLVRYRPNGDLWVASDRGLYLYRSSSGRWSHWTHPFGDRRNRVNEILPAANGDIWLATLDGIEVRGPDGSSHWIRRIRGTELAEVTGLGQDREGNIWVSSGSSFSGVYRWNGRSWSHFELRMPGDSARTNVHKIRPDRNGDLWFLGMYVVESILREGPGAFVLTDGEPVWWEPSSGLPSGRVYDFAEGPDGSLWFGTLKGIGRWRAGEWSTWGTANGLRLRRTFTIEADRSGMVWFGDQSNGLGHLNPASGRIEYLGTADGLVNNQVWEVREGPDGALWISTEGGLGRYQAGEFDAVRTDDGLGGFHVWPVVPGRERVLVGTLNWGVSVLDLTDRLRTAPRVVVEPPAYEETTVRLSWRPFSYWGEVSSSGIRTRWRVDRGEWSDWSTTREVRLDTLDVGRHTLQVQARGPLGAVRREGTLRSFQLAPPLHRRPGFLFPVVGLTLLTLLLLGSILRRRVHHRRELERQEERYRSFFEHDLTGDLISDRLGYILDCNPAFARIFGFSSPAAAVGTRVTELMSSSALRHILRRLRAHGKMEYHELELRDRQGRTVHVIVNLTALFDGRDKLHRVRAYLFDNTERKELEEQLLQSQKMDAIGRLAGGVAHDFNNLLTAITGYTDLLLDDLPENHPMRDDLAEIRRAGRRGKELTSQLLAFGRRQVINPTAVDLGSTVAGMTPLLERAVGAAGSLTSRLAPEGLPVRVDPVRLEQAMLNLVLNARDALDPEGSGTVTLRTRTARVKPEEARTHEGAVPGPYAVIDLQDTGTGIPPEHLDRIFEPFFTTKEVGEGTGLGLPMVYGIVQQSGGFMAVESREGEGSVFSIYLPLLDDPEEVAGPAQEPGGLVSVHG